MAFELISVSKPASVNSEQRVVARFIAGLHREAARRLRGHLPLSGDLYARIIWFHQHQTGDLDNIIKPILDALIGVCYPNDHLVVKCSCEKVDLTAGEIVLSASTTPPAVFDRLVDLLGRDHDHILYVEVGERPSRDLYFGPIR